MNISREEIQLAREFLNGDLDEETFRHRLTDHAKDALIETLKLDLAATRRERDELAEDLKRAMGDLTLLQRQFHHETERGADIASDIFDMATGMNRVIAEQYKEEK